MAPRRRLPARRSPPGVEALPGQAPALVAASLPAGGSLPEVEALPEGGALPAPDSRSAPEGVAGVLLRVRGKVQGVGFRPFVWQLAHQLGLSGDVCNDSAGVIIRLTGAHQAFIRRLRADSPPLAQIDSISQQHFQWPQAPQGFTIRASAAGTMSTRIPPDAATCPACLAELNDPTDLRYRYPFINCTHCGPRFTIIRAMPYDRRFTAMADFALCPQCAAQYRSPADRRFHAQPVACAACGPRLSYQQDGRHGSDEAALQAAVQALLAGQIVAVKGLGGFHLACDATNAHAVARLRQRKRRPDKPLAVMIPRSLPLPPAAGRLIAGPAAPIVLVAAAELPAWPVDQRLADNIAPGVDERGLMWPATPLHHLLIQDCARPLVMTSGNASAQPPALSNQEALAQLADIADGWLLHDRPIVQRADDSLLRQSGEVLRRARGLVPDAIPLPPGFTAPPAVLALGGDLKNTFCLLRPDGALLSQHLGDLSQDANLHQWSATLAHICQLYRFVPQHIVTDTHPGYRTVALGQQLALTHQATYQQVLHHHAHAVACLAEHGWPLECGPVIALALDGIGCGQDGQWWGGECLQLDYRHCQHLGGLPAVALPGGDLAARQPWRNLLAHCLAFVPDWQQHPETRGLRDQGWQALAVAIRRGLNAPRASSCGRLFDAVAAALACCGPEQSYEGEAACRLESLARQAGAHRHPVVMPLDSCGRTLDLALFWQSWLNYRASPARRAWAFIDALCCGLAAVVRYQAKRAGIRTLVLCGGVLHNRIMRAQLSHYLADFTLMMPCRLPAGDGALALGQALIAAATLALPTPITAP